MDQHDQRDGKAVRRIVSQRLRDFYVELCETLDPDTDDFFDRVMRQQRNQAEGDRPRAAR
jgi:hypothetical protein